MVSRGITTVSTLHFLLGLICLAVGVVWVCLHFFEDGFAHKALPYEAFLVMCPEIICGFCILMAALFGFCTKDKYGGCGCMFVMANVFNVIVWTPILVGGYSLLMLTVYRDAAGQPAMCFGNPCLPNDLNSYNLTYLIPPDSELDKTWVYGFPGVGVSVGFIDFIVSIVALVVYCTLKNEKGEKYVQEG